MAVSGNGTAVDFNVSRLIICSAKRADAAGLGVGVLSRFAIASEVRYGELVQLKVPGFPIRRTLYTIHLKRKNLTRMITGFLDLLTSLD